MSKSRLIELSYFAPKSSVRLTVYADTIILDKDGKDSVASLGAVGGEDVSASLVDEAPVLWPDLFCLYGR